MKINRVGESYTKNYNAIPLFLLSFFFNIVYKNMSHTHMLC